MHIPEHKWVINTLDPEYFLLGIVQIFSDFKFSFFEIPTTFFLTGSLPKLNPPGLFNKVFLLKKKKKIPSFLTLDLFSQFFFSLDVVFKKKICLMSCKFSVVLFLILLSIEYLF
jgi:hypothetical protein